VPLNFTHSTIPERWHQLFEASSGLWIFCVVTWVIHTRDYVPLPDNVFIAVYTECSTFLLRSVLDSLRCHFNVSVESIVFVITSSVDATAWPICQCFDSICSLSVFVTSMASCVSVAPIYSSSDCINGGTDITLFLLDITTSSYPDVFGIAFQNFIVSFFGDDMLETITASASFENSSIQSPVLTLRYINASYNFLPSQLPVIEATIIQACVNLKGLDCGSLMIVVELTELRLVFTILWVLLNISSYSMDRQVSFVNHLDLVELHPVNIQLSLADIQHFGVSFRSDSSSFWRLLLGPLLGLLLLYFKTRELLLLILCRTIVELIAWKLSCSFYRLNFSRFLYYIF